MAANRRYLEALSKVADPGDSKEQMRRIGKRVRVDNRSHRPLNPASADDVTLLAAVMRGEHSIQGFRNADIRMQIYTEPSDANEQRRQSLRVGRLLKLLHAHQLIARIPRSRRWRVTKNGYAVLTTILIHHHDKYPATHAQAA